MPPEVKSIVLDRRNEEEGSTMARMMAFTDGKNLVMGFPHMLRYEGYSLNNRHKMFLPYALSQKLKPFSQ